MSEIPTYETTTFLCVLGSELPAKLRYLAAQENCHPNDLIRRFVLQAFDTMPSEIHDRMNEALDLSTPLHGETAKERSKRKRAEQA